MVVKKTMKHILRYKSDLNSIAELGWNETQTTAYIKKVIMDIPIKQGFRNGKTGLVYKLGKGTDSILFRADIDGLKTSTGIKHTCGHSTHMAALIGTYEYVKSLEKTLISKNKSVYFLFQPSEEAFPSGAQSFVSECQDVVKKIKYAFTIHVFPKLKLGTVGLQTGPVWARGDYMEIKITGKMVHVKDNMNGIDALYAAALVIQKIKRLQNNNPSLRIGIGVAEGGRQANTVADFALLKGDIRLKSESQQIRIIGKLKEICREVERNTNAQIKLDYYSGYPVVSNNKGITAKIVSFCKKSTSFIGKIVDRGLFSYGCEDFAYISSLIPSVTAFIGTGDLHDLHEEKCTISDQGTLNGYLYFKGIVDWFIQT